MTITVIRHSHNKIIEVLKQILLSLWRSQTSFIFVIIDRVIISDQIDM